jgi:hypothetical protein
MVSNFIEMFIHFSSKDSTDSFILPGTNRDNGIGAQFFSDQAVNAFRIITFVHDITGRFFRFVTSSQQQMGMSGIVYTVFRRDESDNDLSLGINRDRCFYEMFPDFSGSF